MSCPNYHGQTGGNKGPDKSSPHVCGQPKCDWMVCPCGHIWKLAKPATEPKD